MSIVDKLMPQQGAQALSDAAIDELYREKELRRMRAEAEAALAQGLDVPPVPLLVQANVQLVTPDHARAWVEGMVRNRNMSSKRHDYLVQDMQTGRFYLINQGIGFNTDGRLIDGRHRLEAIIKSGQPQWLLVVRGIDPEAMVAIDRNKVRSLGDQLTIDGLPYGDVVARGSHMVLNTLVAWEKGNSYASLRNPTHTDTAMREQHIPKLLAVIDNDREPAILQWANQARKLYEQGIGAIGVPSAAAMAFYWLAVNAGYRAEVEAFIEEVFVGGAGVHAAVKNLRNRIDTVKNNARTHRHGVDGGLCLVHLLKAFNKYLADDKRKWNINNYEVPTLTCRR
jgi:hypothetical protein